MIPGIDDEHEADANVINVLLNENNKLRRMIPMAYFELTDGRVFQAEEQELNFVSPDDLQAKANKLAEQLKEVEALLPKQEEAAPVLEVSTQNPVEQPSVTELPQAPVDQPIVPPTPEVTPEQPGITLG